MIDEKNKRNAVIDYLRAFAIIGVIIIHLPHTGFVWDSISLTHKGELFINCLVLSYSIPLFILISGISLSIKYQTFKVKPFYIKRLKAIIGPYLFFSIFFLAFRYLNGEATTLSTAVSRIFEGSSYYHLWYMILIPQYYLLFPILLKIYEYFASRKKAGLLLAISLALQVAWGGIMILIFPTTNYSMMNISFSMVFFSLIFYFILGIHIGKQYNQVKDYLKKPFLVTCAIILLISAVTFLTYYRIRGGILYGQNNYSFYHLFDGFVYPISAISAFFLFFKFAYRLEKSKNLTTFWLRRIGRYSFGIYLIHPFFITVIEKKSAELFGAVIPDIIIFSITIAASAIVVYLLSLLPFGKYLVGVSNKDLR